MEATLTVKEAVRLADTWPARIYQALELGVLDGHLVDGKWQIDRRSFEAWQTRLNTRRRLRAEELALT